MSNQDFSGLSRKALFEHFERERLEWLAAGMSEVDIFRIHFGEADENGKLILPSDGCYEGDYFIWLAERKHARPDHKYAPGTPTSIDIVDSDGAWISDGRSDIEDAEHSIDMDAALSTLTELQRTSFIEVKLNGRTQIDVANDLGISRESVKQAINGGLKKLKKYFS